MELIIALTLFVALFASWLVLPGNVAVSTVSNEPEGVLAATV